MQNSLVISIIITALLLMISFVVLFIIALFIATKNTKRLIVIDDNPQLLEDLKGFFEKQGIETTAVSTTEEFCEELKSEKFDFALMDLSLEKDNPSKGLELFYKLYTENRGGMQTFILSGHPTEETQDKFKEMFSQEIKGGLSWETLWRDIHSRYFYKQDVQSLIRLVREMQHVH